MNATITEPDWKPCRLCKCPVFFAINEKTGKPAPLNVPRIGGPAPNVVAYRIDARMTHTKACDGRWFLAMKAQKHRVDNIADLPPEFYCRLPFTPDKLARLSSPCKMKPAEWRYTVVAPNGEIQLPCEVLTITAKARFINHAAECGKPPKK